MASPATIKDLAQPTPTNRHNERPEKIIDDNPNDETTENYEDDEYDDEALSQSELDDIETANEAREWVALLSDPVRALAWAEKQARSMVARFPERDLETELAKWRAVAEAGVEGSGIETEGL